MRGRSGRVGVVHLGIGGFLVLLALSWLTGTNFFSLLQTGDGSPSQSVGTSGELRTTSQSTGPQSATVALELQADCFAGVWGHAASSSGRFQAGHVELEPGDADEALRAAASIGHDRLQKMATGRVMPERFTHGSSAERVEWFKRGMDSGDPASCSTS